MKASSQTEINVAASPRRLVMRSPNTCVYLMHTRFADLARKFADGRIAPAGNLAK